MDSGKEYIVSMHPELFAIHITDEFGNILRGMLQFDNIFINPQHISSLEAVNFEIFLPLKILKMQWANLNLAFLRGGCFFYFYKSD
ncbi:hypothetical protein GCM10020331_058630 [Ectobacillus funiculus]